MIAAEGSAGRAVPHESGDGRAATGAGTPSKTEWWFAYVVLLATAVIPALSARYDLLSQSVIQVFWSVAYVIAVRQLWLMKAEVLTLVRRYAALWALIVLMIASTLWSVSPNTSLIDGIELLGTTTIGLYIAARFTLREFLRILAVVFATTGILCLLLVLGNPGFGRADWGTGPWQGIFEDKNILGAMASLALISQVVLLPSSRGRGRWWLLAGVLLAGLLLVEAQSATAFGDCAFVLVATLTAFACRSRRFGKFARFATALGIPILVASVLLFGLSVDSLYGLLGRSSDLTTRADFWPYLQQAIADRPLLGYGFNAFFQSPLATDYLAPFVEQAGGWIPYHAHDSFLQMELDAGYTGLAALIVVILTALWAAIAYFFRERGSLGIWPLAIVVFLTIGSYTETYYPVINSLQWILFVAAIAYPRERVEPAGVTAAAP